MTWKALDLRWSAHAVDMESERVGRMVRQPTSLLLKVGRGMPDGAVCKVAIAGYVYVIGRVDSLLNIVTMYQDDGRPGRGQICHRDLRWGDEDEPKYKRGRELSCLGRKRTRGIFSEKSKNGFAKKPNSMKICDGERTGGLAQNVQGAEAIDIQKALDQSTATTVGIRRGINQKGKSE